MKETEVRKIAEQNKLIGEFMEIQNLFFFDSERHGFLGLYIANDEDGSIDYVNDGISWYSPHHDWNKLMAVIDKIETLKHNDNAIEFTLRGGYAASFCQVMPWLDWNPAFITGHGFGGSRIEAVYDAVLQFVKQYQTVKE